MFELKDVFGMISLSMAAILLAVISYSFMWSAGCNESYGHMVSSIVFGVLTGVVLFFAGMYVGWVCNDK